MKKQGEENKKNFDKDAASKLKDPQPLSMTPNSMLKAWPLQKMGILGFLSAILGYMVPAAAGGGGGGARN